MKKFITFIILNLFLCLLVNAQRLPEFEKAREIKLLEMNRDDVRKTLSNFKSMRLDASGYIEGFFADTDAKNYIEVTYSLGNCVKFEEWNVPEWTAVEVNITFAKPIAPQTYGIDLKKYKKEKEFRNMPNLYIYHQKEAGIAYEVNRNKIQKIILIPSREKYSLLCTDSKTQKYYSSKNWFTSKLKERWIIIDYANQPANVTNIVLSVSEIIVNCDSLNKKCSNEIKSIAVSSVGEDPEGDVLTYSYTVSGGKIIGQGAKVVWDLSDVKPGTYEITAAVDDGCGFCGKPMTKTVVVKECPDCSNK